MNRSAPMRRTPINRRTSKLGARKGPQRRAVHPFPLPTPGQVVTLEDVRLELLAFGPQAELCRRTECAACFWVRIARARVNPITVIDWTYLPEVGPGTSEAHHEPHRGLKGEALDRDTMPLCAAHHRTGNGDTVRHLLRTDPTDAQRFYGVLPFHWPAVVAEMRRPVAPTKASETP